MSVSPGRETANPGRVLSCYRALPQLQAAADGDAAGSVRNGIEFRVETARNCPGTHLPGLHGPGDRTNVVPVNAGSRTVSLPPVAGPAACPEMMSTHCPAASGA